MSKKAILRALFQYLITFGMLLFFFDIQIDYLIDSGHETMRHGNHFFQINFKTALLLSTVVSIAVMAWQIFAYMKHDGVDPNQMFRARQKYKVKIAQNLSVAEVIEIFEKRLLRRRRWKLLRFSDEQIELSYRFHLISKDYFTLSKREDGWLMESRPRFWAWYMDNARNYRHIKNISQEILDNN